LGLYQRSDSRFWWMSYTMNGEQHQESTKTAIKELAIKIIKQRESEIVLGLFKVGWAGERMTFDQLSAEFERSHFAGLAENTVNKKQPEPHHKRGNRQSRAGMSEVRLGSCRHAEVYSGKSRRSGEALQ